MRSGKATVSVASVGLDVTGMLYSTESARRWSRLGWIKFAWLCGLGATKGSVEKDPDVLGRDEPPVSCRDDFDVRGDGRTPYSGKEEVEVLASGIPVVSSSEDFCIGGDITRGCSNTIDWDKLVDAVTSTANADFGPGGSKDAARG
jgi:hypothetical protein